MDLLQIIQNYKASIRPELHIDVSKTGLVYTHPEGNFIIDFNAPNVNRDLIFCFTLDSYVLIDKTKIKPLTSLFGDCKDFPITCDLLVVIGIEKNENHQIYFVAIEFKAGKAHIRNGFRQVAASLEFLTYCNNLHGLFHKFIPKVQRRKFVFTRSGKLDKTETHRRQDYSTNAFYQREGDKTLITDLINLQK